MAFHGGQRVSRAIVAAACCLAWSGAIPGLRIVATCLYDRHVRGTYWTELDPPYAVDDRVAGRGGGQPVRQRAALDGIRRGTWRHPNDILVNVNAQYHSAFFQDTGVQTTPDIRSLTLVNARVGWQGRHLGAFVIACNLFNVARPIQSFADLDGRARGVASPPRTIGLDLEARL